MSAEKKEKEKFSIKKFLKSKMQNKQLVKTQPRAEIIIDKTPISSTFFNKEYESAKRSILRWD